MKNVFIRIATSVVAAGIMMGTAHAGGKKTSEAYNAGMFVVAFNMCDEVKDIVLENDTLKLGAVMLVAKHSEKRDYEKGVNYALKMVAADIDGTCSAAATGLLKGLIKG